MIEKNKLEGLAFYETQIAQIKWVIEDIKQRGIEALNDIDKPKGVIEALRIMNEQLIYFQEAKKKYIKELEVANKK